MLVCTAVLDPCHYSNEILEVSIAVGAGCQISLNTLKKTKKKKHPHIKTGLIYMQTHTWYALLNQFKSAVCSFPSATVPFKPPSTPTARVSLNILQIPR